MTSTYSNTPPFREVEFIDFLVKLLRKAGAHSVLCEVSLAPGKVVDLVIDSGRQVSIIETKRSSPQTRLRIDDALSQLKGYEKAAANGPFAGRELQPILAIPNSLSAEKVSSLQREGVEVWDGSRIAQMALHADMREEASRFIGEQHFEITSSPAFVEKLLQLPRGKGSWSPYQKLCRDIAEFLFCPPLRSPIWESSNAAEVNKRDFILPNYATGGFWKFLREKYHADYVVVDAKNYQEGVEKKEVLQIANYLSLHGTGLFALIMTREDPRESGSYTIRDQWIQHGKLIVTLNDREVEQMLVDKSFGNDPSELIRQKIEDFRLGI
ncbi:hypothetical protein [Streptomyces sp. wa1064]|uniref:hypothetical protein n=1 Tax=Streptomyces sp. wa1064 TaxID=1828213 RepID=UPI0037B6069B